MVVGLRINCDRTFSDFDYTIQDMIDSRLSIFAMERGIGDYNLIEQFTINNKTYLIYGWLNGRVFNRFDLDTCNPYGDMILMAIDNETRPTDVIQLEVLEHFVSINLDDTLIQDELDLEIGNYEYNTFVVDEDNNSDYLDYVDYPDTDDLMDLD